MTGIRSWIGFISPFASVVRIVQVSTGSPSLSQRSHNRSR